jgi:hypothetical protein
MQRKTNSKKHIYSLCNIIFLISLLASISCSKQKEVDMIKKQGIKLRSESIKRDREYLFIKLGYNTNGQYVELNKIDFTLVDRNNIEYKCEGLYSDIQPSGFLFSTIKVMNTRWEAAQDINIVFHNAPSNENILGVKYKGSHAFKVIK